MTYKYYKLDEGEVRITAKEVTPERLIGKNWLPYERVVKTEFAETESETDELEILEDKVVRTIIKYKIAPTLEEIKVAKKNSINSDCQSNIYENYPINKQMSALLGIYGEDYLLSMKTFIQEKIDKSNTLNLAIDSKTTKEDVDLIYWKEIKEVEESLQL